MKPATWLPFSRGTTRRIAMSPWSMQAMGAEKLAELDARADALDVNVSTIKRRDGAWMVRVRSAQGNTGVQLVGQGSLEAVVAGALSDYEEAVRA